jgi:tannase
MSGATDAGYDVFSYSYDQVVLYSNGSINWDATYMFAYQALGEMTTLGKTLTRNFYGLSSEARIYTHYEGCSDGGREGMSQVQLYGGQYDGDKVIVLSMFHVSQRSASPSSRSTTSFPRLWKRL